MGSAFSKKKPVEDTKVENNVAISQHEVVITSLLSLNHSSLQKIEIHNDDSKENHGGTLKIFANTKNSKLLQILKDYQNKEQEFHEMDIGLIIVISDGNIEESEQGPKAVDSDSYHDDVKSIVSEKNTTTETNTQEASTSEDTVHTESAEIEDSNFIDQLIEEINLHSETLFIQETQNGTYEIHISEETIVSAESEIDSDKTQQNSPDTNDENVDDPKAIMDPTDVSPTSSAISNETKEDDQKKDDLDEDEADSNNVKSNSKDTDNGTDDGKTEHNNTQPEVQDKNIDYEEKKMDTSTNMDLKTSTVFPSEANINRTEIENKMLELRASRSQMTKTISDLSEQVKRNTELHKTGELYLSSPP